MQTKVEYPSYTTKKDFTTKYYEETEKRALAVLRASTISYSTHGSEVGQIGKKQERKILIFF